MDAVAGEPSLLKARITHLEMLAPPAGRVPMPFGPKLAVLRAEAIPLAFYRWLYEQVGRPHHWLLRRNIADGVLAELVHSDNCEIQVLYCGGCPAGFFELDLSELPHNVEILYFGLTPDYQGRGLARFFLSEAIFAAWAHGPDRVVIHTNTLDSPRALQLYQRAGFTPYAWSEEDVPAWE